MRKPLEIMVLGAVFATLAFSVPVSAKEKKSKPKPVSATANDLKGESVWIMRPDGAESCNPGSGQGLEKGRSELIGAGIPVSGERKGNDGKAHIQMCGAPQGTLNLYEIPAKNLKDALALGFQPAAQPN